ncbi:MAG TPA: DUF3180 domain-containing protein [Phycicoccus sp.]|nr:DUF3180 domain-containing protein [Phycicoccus sp.]
MTRAGLTQGRVASVALVVGGISAIGWTLWQRSGRLIPAPPLLGAVLFALLVVFVLVLAWPVRNHLQGRARRVLDPLRAARALVFAQAAALTGAALTGWYAAQLALAVAERDLTVYREAIWRFAALTVGAMLLAGAGLLAQSWCRVEPPDDSADDRSRRGSNS